MNKAAFLFFVLFSKSSVFGGIILVGPASVDFDPAGIVLPTTSTAATISAVATPTSVSDQRILTFANSTNSNFAIVWGRGGSKFGCLGRTVSGTLVEISSARNFGTGVPYSVVCAASTGNMSLYVNGVFESSATTVSPTGMFGTLSTALTQTARIGLPPRASNTPFSGTIDEARLYNRFLTEEEIITLGQSNMHALITDGLIGYWILDEEQPGVRVSSTSVIDRSGNGRNSIGAIGPPTYTGSRMSYP